MAMNFVQALSDARRRAQLTGRPLSAQEVSGIASGYFQDAAARNDAARRTNIAQAGQTTAEKAQAAQESQFAQKLSDERDALAKNLALKEKELEQRGLEFGQNLETNKTQFGETLALSKERMAGEMSAADAARKQQLTGNVLQGAGTGALVYGYGKNAGWWGAKATPPVDAIGGAGGVAPLIPVTEGSTLAPAAEIGTESAFNAGAGTAGGELATGATAGSIVGTAAPYVAAARVGMPVLGNALQQISPGEPDSSNFFQQAATITKDDYMRPIEAGSAALGAELPEAVETIINPAGKALSSGTVICTELHRQGLLDGAVWENDGKYRAMVSPEVYEGYRILADPVVRLMQRSKLFTAIIAPFALATAREMAHRVNRDIEGNTAGKALLGFFVPICLWLGSRRGNVLDPVRP